MLYNWRLKSQSFDDTDPSSGHGTPTQLLLLGSSGWRMWCRSTLSYCCSYTDCRCNNFFLSYITLHYRQPKLFKSRISVERKFCFIIWTHFKWQHGKKITLPVKRILHCFLENIHQNPPSLSLCRAAITVITHQVQFGETTASLLILGPFLAQEVQACNIFPPTPRKFFSKIRVS